MCWCEWLCGVGLYRPTPLVHRHRILALEHSKQAQRGIIRAVQTHLNEVLAKAPPSPLLLSLLSPIVVALPVAVWGRRGRRVAGGQSVKSVMSESAFLNIQRTNGQLLLPSSSPNTTPRHLAPPRTDRPAGQRLRHRARGSHRHLRCARRPRDGGNESHPNSQEPRALARHRPLAESGRGGHGPLICTHHNQLHKVLSFFCLFLTPPTVIFKSLYTHPRPPNHSAAAVRARVRPRAFFLSSFRCPCDCASACCCCCSSRSPKDASSSSSDTPLPSNDDTPEGGGAVAV